MVSRNGIHGSQDLCKCVGNWIGGYRINYVKDILSSSEKYKCSLEVEI